MEAFGGDERPGLHQEHQLGARALAVDDRRRELGLRCDVGHPRGPGRRAAIASDLNRRADAQRGADPLRRAEPRRPLTGPQGGSATVNGTVTRPQ